MRDARGATGRNLETGEVEPDKVKQAGCWLGAVGYMIMFDQVGTSYRPLSTVAIQGATFTRALEYFVPEVSEPEREALYALRCSFVHDFSLINVGKGANQQLRELRTHHFILDDAEQSGPVVRLPLHRWDGELAHCRKGNATWVNLRSLGDLAETVFKRLIALQEKGELTIALTGGLLELQRRYAMTIYPGLHMQES